MERYIRLTILLILAALAFIPGTGASASSSPQGLWAPMENGKPLGVVRIYEQDGVFFGRIEPSSASANSSARCTRCTDERRNQPLIGLLIMRNLKAKHGEYVGGDILHWRAKEKRWEAHGSQR